jgi:hypothetical protein
MPFQLQDFTYSTKTCSTGTEDAFDASAVGRQAAEEGSIRFLLSCTSVMCCIMTGGFADDSMQLCNAGLQSCLGRNSLRPQQILMEFGGCKTGRPTGKKLKRLLPNKRNGSLMPERFFSLRTRSINKNVAVAFFPFRAQP